VAVAYQIDLIDAGHRVISWQGIRREESFHRRNAKKMERIGPSLWAFRPLVDWTAAQVFEAHKAHGIEPNPLYKQGMPRVGCMPCIHCNKEQIREISVRFPEYLDQKAQWETLVSQAAKHGFSTYFHKDISGASGKDYDIYKEQNIAAIIEWSRTGRGGRQLSFLDQFIDGDVCSSSYGLCE
jgi:3'-phosphoadenosine 5'-phosphosulfate sulfotransferase (PAPS reductase)/FAD synthetase